MCTRNYSRPVNHGLDARDEHERAGVISVNRLHRLRGRGDQRHLDDRVIGIYPGNVSRLRRVMIDDVVPVRRRPVLVVVVDVVGRRVNVQLGCLHVHQRQAGNQREREQPMERPYHLVPNIVLHPDYFHVISMPKKCTKTCRFGLFFAFCCGLRM
jgi:hypothetical protein